MEKIGDDYLNYFLSFCDYLSKQVSYIIEDTKNYETSLYSDN